MKMFNFTFFHSSLGGTACYTTATILKDQTCVGVDTEWRRRRSCSSIFKLHLTSSDVRRRFFSWTDARGERGSGSICPLPRRERQKCSVEPKSIFQRGGGGAFIWRVGQNRLSRLSLSLSTTAVQRIPHRQLWPPTPIKTPCASQLGWNCAWLGGDGTF